MAAQVINVKIQFTTHAFTAIWFLEFN